MSKQILINSSQQETRIALLEDNRISELFFERDSDKGIVGNIYKGKVVRVLPGMQAAFVDIGHERAAFLYAGDFVHSKHNTEDADFDDGDSRNDSGSGRRRRRSPEDVPPIASLVREGQEILVQVAKGPLGTKGARLTCHLSLPGRYLVFMPHLKHNGVSRKIDSYDLRKKLKRLIDQHKSKQGGFIVRTAAGAGAKGITEKAIKSDVEYLTSLWTKINRKYKSNGAPKLLHYDLDLTTRMIRDHLDDEIDFMIVDSPVEHRRVLKFIRNFNPELADKVELYRERIPLFDRYMVEAEINRTLGKRVWLKSGGYLIIENTEALCSIDVNTGRFVGKKNLEETILRTNVEAAEEIVRQLRLRNIGGIIIIDFIDMEKENSKEQVYRHLDNLVRKDKQRTTVLKISNLGLVEMTRKRSREPIHRYHTMTCPTCDGRAFVKRPITLAHQVLRDIRRELPFIDADYLNVTTHPEVYEILSGAEKQAIVSIEKHYQKGIKLNSDPAFHIEQVAVTPANAPNPKAAALPRSPIIDRLEKISTGLREWTQFNKEDAEEDPYSEEEYREQTQRIEQRREALLQEIEEKNKERAAQDDDAEDDEDHQIDQEQAYEGSDSSEDDYYEEDSYEDDDDTDDEDDDSPLASEAESNVESPIIRSRDEVRPDDSDDEDEDDDGDDINRAAKKSSEAEVKTSDENEKEATQLTTSAQTTRGA